MIKSKFKLISGKNRLVEWIKRSESTNPTRKQINAPWHSPHFNAILKHDDVRS